MASASYDPAAERAALDWLELADRGEARGTWSTAASLFRGAVPEAQWAQLLAGTRTPLGGVISRTLESARSETELPGAPDGEYVVLQFTTSFERKRTATETVTPMRDADGEWRVSGYFIR